MGGRWCVLVAGGGWQVGGRGWGWVGRCKVSEGGRGIEDRIFYGIFNVTRVMNDHYGWRPEAEEEET